MKKLKHYILILAGVLVTTHVSRLVASPINNCVDIFIERQLTFAEALKSPDFLLPENQTKQYTKDLFSREPGSDVKAIYLENALESLRDVFGPRFLNGRKFSTKEFIKFLRQTHFYARGGHSGKAYLGSDGRGKEDDCIYGIDCVDVNGRILDRSSWSGPEGTEIYQDYFPQRISAVGNSEYQRRPKMLGMPAGASPWFSIGWDAQKEKIGLWNLSYSLAKYVPAYLDQMTRVLNNILTEAHGKRDLQKIIYSLADYHQLFVNSHAFTRANNSIAMGQVNYILESLGLKGISHGYLDYHSFLLDYEDYREVFYQKVKANNSNLPSHAPLVFNKSENLRDWQNVKIQTMHEKTVLSALPQSSLSITAHISYVGDRTVSNNSIRASEYAGESIEGLSVSSDSLPDGVHLEYAVKSVGLTYSAWTTNGEFVGTRGQSLPLENLAFRLTGKNAKRYTVLYQVFGSLMALSGTDGDQIGYAPITGLNILIYKK